MAKLVLSKNMNLDELSAFLKSEMPKYTVEIKGMRVWVTQNIFQGCYIKPKTDSSTTTLFLSGDMPGLGRVVMLGGLILLALIVYALTGVLVVGGILLILGIFVLRKLPSSALAVEVKTVLEGLSGKPKTDI